MTQVKKIDQNSAAVKQPNAKNGLSKQLSDWKFIDCKQLEIEVKNCVTDIKIVRIWEILWNGCSTENGQFGLDYGHKIQSSIQSNIWLCSNR